KIVAYIPNNAYLVYGTPQNLARVHDLSNRASYVQWEGTYQPRFKLDPNVRTGNKGINPGSSDLYAIQLFTDGTGNQATMGVINSLKTESIRSQSRVLNYTNIIVKLPTNAVEKQIAARPDVVSIAPYIEPVKFDERQNIIMAGNLLGNS